MEQILEKPDQSNLNSLMTIFQRLLNTLPAYEPANAVFSTFKGQQDGQQPAQNSSRPQSKTPTCFCGKNYWLKDCWHLNKNARRRPKDFTPDPEVIAQAHQEITLNGRRAEKLREAMKLSGPTTSSNTLNRELVCTTIASTAVNTIPKYRIHSLSIQVQLSACAIISTGSTISLRNMKLSESVARLTTALESVRLLYDLILEDMTQTGSASLSETFNISLDSI
jgi:hypothetical protein